MSFSCCLEFIDVSGISDDLLQNIPLEVRWVNVSFFIVHGMKKCHSTLYVYDHYLWRDATEVARSKHHRAIQDVFAVPRKGTK